MNMNDDEVRLVKQQQWLIPENNEFQIVFPMNRKVFNIFVNYFGNDVANRIFMALAEHIECFSIFNWIELNLICFLCHFLDVLAGGSKVPSFNLWIMLEKEREREI